MKRSEMLSKIASVIINFNEAHRQTPREGALEMAETILQVQEEAGMYPPEADTMNNSEHLVLYIDNIDIPHWMRLGWDDEEK